MLSNGASILRRQSNIVLAQWDKGSHREYVTWMVGNDGGACWGTITTITKAPTMTMRRALTGDFDEHL